MPSSCMHHLAGPTLLPMLQASSTAAGAGSIHVVLRIWTSDPALALRIFSNGGGFMRWGSTGQNNFPMGVALGTASGRPTCVLTGQAAVLPPQRKDSH